MAGASFDQRFWPIEDRRAEGPPSWESGRLFDPTPLQRGLQPSYLPPGGYWAQDNPEIPGAAESPLARALGVHQIQRAHMLDMLRLMGFGPETIEEQKRVFERNPPPGS